MNEPATMLSVARNGDGQYQITDQRGKLVEGPFETNAAAWRALDRLASENNAPPKRISKKKVLWGKPDAPKPPKAKRGSRKTEARQEHRMRINAAKAPGWVRAVAAAKFDPAGERQFRDHKLGTFGAASEVRRIDPAEYLAAKARGEA